jgi:hypothetical protein
MTKCRAIYGICCSTLGHPGEGSSRGRSLQHDARLEQNAHVSLRQHYIRRPEVDMITPLEVAQKSREYEGLCMSGEFRQVTNLGGLGRGCGCGLARFSVS